MSPKWFGAQFGANISLFVMRYFMKRCCLTTLAAGALCAAPVYAQGSKGWETFSDVGAYGLVATAAAVPLYKEDWQGFWQAGLSIGTASAIGLLGKVTIEEERPDKSGFDSFPSNHTANAFASATTLQIRYGWQAGLPAYTIATLVGVGRVEAKRHYWRDVIAGAALGTLSAWMFTDAYDENIQVLPWVSHDGAGIHVAYQF
ncbi:phosphatase PAP2 family protein [Vibrio vulnificus]|uniref:phosphatase PAP2 family protein n=1 Tax=Vibrio vulnificus TaxID=672 RepID=UPI001E5855CB|nr:phosphatase PAP2 family protein [Vibrio vulnificus]EGR1512337.1 phosphatase PAP2 family protein [Vibrio vulnificus]ELR8704167.1 phosphatase PAP2 family protein [Vibrio vulnificus]ELR8772411.1 phosphatase PAP2 family protein [Vibrio vulnificus]MCD1411817.1 phosphatase PAP2 family protein [Vibrio vulnificus]MCD1420882.1 phosphatase PAP2 family protein [Vibrio vulnificus]